MCSQVIVLFQVGAQESLLDHVNIIHTAYPSSQMYNLKQLCSQTQFSSWLCYLSGISTSHLYVTNLIKLLQELYEKNGSKYLAIVMTQLSIAIIIIINIIISSTKFSLKNQLSMPLSALETKCSGLQRLKNYQNMKIRIKIGN